ncbi:hypothetical protein E4K10_02115 [Streptomyces sp. T1317-0309]|nr:hypothetical protein E4K10_02115 [Streptomyces sp. T1317-0309]
MTVALRRLPDPWNEESREDDEPDAAGCPCGSEEFRRRRRGASRRGRRPGPRKAANRRPVPSAVSSCGCAGRPAPGRRVRSCAVRCAPPQGPCGPGRRRR